LHLLPPFLSNEPGTELQHSIFPLYLFSLFPPDAKLRLNKHGGWMEI
jgi:hypothetical protein